MMQNRLDTHPLATLAAGLLMLVVTLPAKAQTVNQTTDGSEKRYYVEILVFQRDSASESLYRFPGEPAVEQALDFWPQQASLSGPAASGSIRDSRRRQASPFGNPRSPAAPATPLLPITDLFVPMPDQSLVMVREWRALSAEPGLSPLVQRGWHQPAAPFGDSMPVRIRGGEQIDSVVEDSAGMLLGSVRRRPIMAVDGTAALERGRYLHLRVDLALHRRGRPGLPHYGDIKTLDQVGNYTTHRIRERRQITLNAVNYFDHRFFGVVALVKSWPLDGGAQQENQ